MFDNRNTACTTWHLSYTNSGFSALQIQFEKATNVADQPGVWVVWPNLASGTTLPLTDTSNSQATGYRYQPWVRVRTVSVTGTGRVYGILYGWRPVSNQDASGTSTATVATDSGNRTIVVGPTATGVAPSTSPVYIAGIDESGQTRPPRYANADGAQIAARALTGADNISNGSGALAVVTNGGSGYLGIWNYVYDGATWDRWPGNSANGAQVALNSTVAGLTDGNSNSFSNLAGSGGGTIATYTYGMSFNGTTWDRLRGDTKGLEVHGPRSGFTCYVTSTATTIQAFGGSCVAPGAGNSLYITDISFGTSAAAGTAADSYPTLKFGTGGTCGSGTAVLWAALGVANSTIVGNFTTPLKVTANNELCWIMSTAGTKVITISGFIGPG